MFGFLKILLGNVFRRPLTDPFPFAPAKTPQRFRGKIHLNPNLCVGCGICRHVCAGHAIHIEARADGSGYDWVLWYNTCALCGMCCHYCPTGAISMSNDWHNAHLESDKYGWREEHFVPYLSCAGCGARIRPLPTSVTGRVYADNDVNVQHIVQLCPECRARETAIKEEQNEELQHPGT